jgi:phosphoribosylamine--glycine ligase
MDTTIYHAGTANTSHGLVSSGGRVLTITGLGKDLQEAREKAYGTITKIACEKSFFRTDIALTASEGK